MGRSKALLPAGPNGPTFVRHLADALLVAYNPHTTGPGFAVGDLLVVAVWGALGLVIAVKRFSWLPLGR